MRKQIFLLLQQALLEIVDDDQNPLIQHVDLWNHQLDLAEEEQPFNTPAVFIEFADIAWQTLPHGSREAVCNVSLHVVTDSRVGRWHEAIATLDLLDFIYANLFGLAAIDTDNNRCIDSFTLLSSHTDHYFDELQDNVETYSCHVTDGSIAVHKPQPEAPAVPQVSVSILTADVEPPDNDDSPILGE